MAKNFAEWPEVLSPADVIEYVGLPHGDTWRMFKEADFPSLFPDKQRGRLVGKHALRAYLNKGEKADVD